METRDELDELKRLRSENKALKEAYAELVLNHKCSEKVIEVADEMFNLDLKKVRTRVIGLLQEEEAVSRLCLYFGISRQAYYKSNSQMVKSVLKTGIVVDMVQKVRRQMPRLGGKKLYHLLGATYVRWALSDETSSLTSCGITICWWFLSAATRALRSLTIDFTNGRIRCG